MTILEPLSFNEKVAFLGSLEIFSRLESQDLAYIAAITKQYAFEKGRVLIHQGDVADKLHIIHSGRVEAYSINEDGITRRERMYIPGQIFEDSWLFNPSTHAASIRARQDGIMMIIDSEPFLKLLADKNFQHIARDLNLSDEAEEQYRKSPLALGNRRYKSINLVPGELVEFETKRSRWVLFAKLFFPLLLLSTIPTLTYLYLPTIFQNLGMSWVIATTLLFTILFGLYALFEYIDWANDYLIITNKRLVHFEFQLRSLSGSGQDTLIEQVQSVETARPNLISTILDIGTARVTTAALSVLYFDYLPEPEVVERTINDIKSRKGQLSASSEKANMRRSVEQYFQIPEMLHELDQEKPPRPPLTQWEKAVKTWNELPRYRYRTEEGSVITYRKHIFALFIETIWPLSIFFLLILSLFVLRYLQLDGFAWVIFILMFLDGLVILWQAEDWRNDTFQLTETDVIDIDRLPFGFRESRKQARLDNIQNVEAVRPNVFATIFRFGNVEIETAGADSKIVFENVANPQGIKNDVFKKRDKFEKEKAAKRAETERKRYAIALDVFLQERELDRIGRRTPDFDQAIEDIAEQVLNSQRPDGRRP